MNKYIVFYFAVFCCFGVQNVKAQYCVLNCKYTYSAETIGDLSHSSFDISENSFSQLNFSSSDVSWYIYPSTKFNLVIGNKPNDIISFGIFPFSDLKSVKIDTLKAEKSYMIPFVGMFDYGMFGYIYEFGESPINCQIQAFVTISVQFYDKLDFDNHLCEGNIIPINNSLFTLTEKVNSYFNYQNAETLRNPIFLISAVDDSDQWETITQSDLTFNGFRDFVSQHFPGKSIFDDRFKIKVKFLLFETEPVLLPQYYRNYPLKDNSLNVKDSTLYIGLENIATGGEISIRSDFYPSTNKGEISLDNSNYINQDSGYFKTPLHGPYTITFHKDKHCSVSRNVFVPEVTLNKVNGSGNVFWYEGETRKAVTLHLKYPEGRNDNITYTTNNNLPNDSITVSTESVGKISILDTINFNKSIDTNCIYKTAAFTTDKSLETINVTVTSSGKKFIPVHIHLDDKLTSYPNIQLASDVAKDIFPHCYESDAVLKFPVFKGGLSNGYYYQLNDDDSLPIPQTYSLVLDKSLKSFSVKIFDNLEGMQDTIGRVARSLDLGTFTVNRPSQLQIKDSVSYNLRCHNDFTGSIEIKDLQLSYPNEDVAYSWFRYPYEDKDKLAISTSKADSLSADTYQVVINNNDCILQQEFTITQPDTLLTSVTSVTNAMCYGYHDGSITSETTGGTKNDNEDYTYSWSNGATTKDIDGLPIGRYYLTVTDAHGCEAYANDTITQPDELINSLTPSYTICQGGELLIDDGKENRKVFDSYEWHLPDSTIQQGRLLIVSTDMLQGKYVLKSKNEDCFTLDTTLITFADNNLPIRFLVPTESFFDDTLVIAEDSEIDDDYSWRYAYNTEMFSDITDKVVNPNANLTFLHIDRSGNDTITMYADNGFCKASLSKEVTVSPHFRSEDYDYTVDAAGIFSRLQIGPNPNNGEFTLFANLTEDSPLSIALYDVMRSRKIPIDFSKYKTPASHYQIPFQGLGLHSGAYTLLVSANGETKQIKFVVE